MVIPYSFPLWGIATARASITLAPMVIIGRHRSALTVTTTPNTSTLVAEGVICTAFTDASVEVFVQLQNNCYSINSNYFSLFKNQADGCPKKTNETSREV
jgi:hypothetical protein